MEKDIEIDMEMVETGDATCWTYLPFARQVRTEANKTDQLGLACAYFVCL